MGEVIHLHPTRLLTRKELADHFRVHVSTVDRWVGEGMPSETFGLRIRRFRLHSVESWVGERRSA